MVIVHAVNTGFPQIFGPNHLGLCLHQALPDEPPPPPPPVRHATAYTPPRHRPHDSCAACVDAVCLLTVQVAGPIEGCPNRANPHHTCTAFCRSHSAAAAVAGAHLGGGAAAGVQVALSLSPGRGSHSSTTEVLLANASSPYNFPHGSPGPGGGGLQVPGSPGRGLGAAGAVPAWAGDFSSEEEVEFG